MLLSTDVNEKNPLNSSKGLERVEREFSGEEVVRPVQKRTKGAFNLMIYDSYEKLIDPVALRSTAG